MGASRTGVLTAGPEPLSKVTVEFLVVKSVRQPKRPQGDTKKDNRMQNEHKEMMTKKRHSQRQPASVGGTFLYSCNSKHEVEVVNQSAHLKCQYVIFDDSVRVLVVVVLALLHDKRFSDYWIFKCLRWI